MAVTSATSTNTVTNNTSASQTSSVSLAKDFNTFLTLLTTQLKNQDPTSPMDTKEFTNQLVQFSQVEQQIRQNSNLEKLVAAATANSGANLVNYIGKQIEAEGEYAPLKDGQANWTYDVPSGAASTQIGVYDSTGKLVFSKSGSTKSGHNAFDWDGKTAAGNQLADGTYSLTVVAKDSKGKVLDTKTYAKGTVNGVETDGDTQYLTIGNVRIDPAKVVFVRAVDTPAAAS